MSLCICGHVLNQHENGWSYSSGRCLIGIEDDIGDRCPCQRFQPIGQEEPAQKAWRKCEVCLNEIKPGGISHQACRDAQEKDEQRKAKELEQSYNEQRRREREQQLIISMQQFARARESTDLCTCGHEELAHDLPNENEIPRSCNKCRCSQYGFDRKPTPSYTSPTQGQGIVCTCGHRPQDHLTDTPFVCGVWKCLCREFIMIGQQVQQARPVKQVQPAGTGLPPEPGKRKIDL